MKLRRYEMLLIAATLMFMCFTAGFFAGKNRTGAEVTIETQYTSRRSSEDKLGVAEEESEVLPIELSLSEKININTAGADELKILPGIGDVLAKRIIEYREKHGGFATIYDITAVSGIGEARFEDIESYITVREE